MQPQLPYGFSADVPNWTDYFKLLVISFCIVDTSCLLLLLFKGLVLCFVICLGVQSSDAATERFINVFEGFAIDCGFTRAKKRLELEAAQLNSLCTHEFNVRGK